MKKVLRNIIVVTVLITSVLMLALLSGCTTKYEKIYDDDSLIVRYNSYGDSDYISNNTIDGLYVSSESFSGVETLIYAFTVDSKTSAKITINYPLAGVVGGKIKVVLADNDNVYFIGSCGQFSKTSFGTHVSQNIDFNKIPNGVYSLKIVGVKANFEMWFSY